MQDQKLQAGLTYAPATDFDCDDVAFRKGERLLLTDVKFSHYDGADVYYFQDAAGGIREWWLYRQDHQDPAAWFLPT